MEVCIIFLLLSSLTANGVFGDEVSVSVMEGHSVTLHTDVTHIHIDHLIVWTYGPENTFVARIKGKADSTMYSDDGRFRDKVKMNDQTGDLIITHITSQHSGLYRFKISRNMKVSYKNFHLTVNAKTETTAETSPPAPPTSDDPYSLLKHILLIPLESLLCLIAMMVISLYINGVLME